MTVVTGCEGKKGFDIEMMVSFTGVMFVSMNDFVQIRKIPIQIDIVMVVSTDKPMIRSEFLRRETEICFRRRSVGSLLSTLWRHLSIDPVDSDSKREQPKFPIHLSRLDFIFSWSCFSYLDSSMATDEYVCFQSIVECPCCELDIPRTDIRRGKAAILDLPLRCRACWRHI